MTSTPNPSQNLPPVTVDWYLSNWYGAAINWPDSLLYRDTDPDGDQLSVVTPAGSSSVTFHGQYGNLVLQSNGLSSYQANVPAPSGVNAVQDIFTFQVTDGHANVVDQKVTFGMAILKPPVVADDNASVALGKTVTGNILTNDTDQYGFSLSVANPGTIKGSHGNLVLSADGTYSYKSTDISLPAAGYVKDTFDITVKQNIPFNLTDGQSHTAPEHLSLITTASGTTQIFDGSGGGATLTGTTAADLIFGGPNDVLTGGAGPDTFVFGPSAGKNTITDFDPKVDKLVIDRSLITGISQISSIGAYIHQSGTDLVISDGHGDALTLQHTTFASFLRNIGHDVVIV